MELDMIRSESFCAKVKNHEWYAQNLYAALCNNDFSNEKGEVWSCSWRYAGGIVARIRQEGDYLDWYCSGINKDLVLEEKKWVGESVVTEEIRADLLQLGWKVMENE